jgi:hypothetical protein
LKQAFATPEIKIEDTVLHINNMQKRKVRKIERERQGFVFKRPLSVPCLALSVISAEYQ